MNPIIQQAMELCPVELRGADGTNYELIMFNELWWLQPQKSPVPFEPRSVFEAESLMEKFWREKLGARRWMGVRAIPSASNIILATQYGIPYLEALAAAIVAVFGKETP